MDINRVLNMNIVTISGILEEDFHYEYTIGEKNFYKSKIKVLRTSGVPDNIPLVIPENMIQKDAPVVGKIIELRGSIRSNYRYYQAEKRHLEIYVFPYEIHICNEENEMIRDELNTNKVYMQGIIMNTKYRITPFGRIITDILLRVPRDSNDKYYVIPCIAWGTTAEKAKNLNIGDNFGFEGRFQSRTYIKRSSPDSEKGKLLEAYEVSIMRADF